MGKNTIPELMKKEKNDLKQLLREKGFTPEESMESIILVGGMGTRLNPERKKISAKDFPEMDKKFWNRDGPKGMAMMSCRIGGRNVRKPMTDWHLDIHTSCKEIKKIMISVAQNSDVIINYYQNKHNFRYNNVPLDFIVEKNPAGTIAPLAKLFQSGKLSSSPMVYANGDDLIDVDFYRIYLVGVLKALELGLNIDELVIDIVSMVDWKESSQYGVIDMNFNTGIIHSFREKNDNESNKYIEVDGKKMVPISSGFSVILNPEYLLKKHLTRDVIETCNKLEIGELDYKENENVVKYEFLYGRLANKGVMIGIYSDAYWIDLATEDRVSKAEKHFPDSSIFNKETD
jgi:NDP-sugar pyrophosphorylase family protein